MDMIKTYEMWPEVSRRDFAQYLANCADYLRDNWGDGDTYRFRHNDRVFAFDPYPGKGNVHVRRELLERTPESKEVNQKAGE